MTYVKEKVEDCKWKTVIVETNQKQNYKSERNVRNNKAYWVELFNYQLKDDQKEQKSKQ